MRSRVSHAPQALGTNGGLSLYSRTATTQAGRISRKPTTIKPASIASLFHVKHNASQVGTDPAMDRGAFTFSRGAVAGGMALVRGDNSSAFYRSNPESFGYTIVDDADTSGTWTAGTYDGGVAGDYLRYTPSDDYELEEDAAASWTADVESGRLVQVFASWTPSREAGLATYTVTGAKRVGSWISDTSDPDALNATTVDQRFTPGEIIVDGARWRSLGYYLPDSSNLTVELSAEMSVIADAIMVVDDWDFTTPAGSLNELEHDSLESNVPGYDPSDGAFTLVTRHGNRAQFDDAGLLQNTVDRHGNRVELQYTDSDAICNGELAPGHSRLPGFPPVPSPL